MHDFQSKIHPYGDFWMKGNNTKGKWKSQKKKMGVFRSYCKKLCEQSLITGFPVIASSRSSVRRLVKSAVFVLCVGGFLYQTSTFLELYWTFPTMVDISIQNLDRISMPAVTVCNDNRIRRTEICKVEKEICKEDDSARFCALYPRYCYGTGINVVPVTVNPTAQIIRNHTFEFVQTVGQRKQDFFGDGKSCSIITNTKRFCKNFAEIPAVDGKGYPNICTTVETIIGHPDEVPENIPVTGQMPLILMVHPEEYVSYTDLPKLYIEVHDPRAISNPLVDGISLYPGKRYDIHVNAIETFRLPTPYKTNCTNYLKKWMENGGYGPMDKRACAEMCKVEASFKEFGCVPESVKYPRTYPTCSTKSYISEDIIERCSEDCEDACRDITYTMRSELKDDFSLRCKPGDEYCKNRLVFATILFYGMKLTTFKHGPKYASIEVFSYIGGYMGMWLGISLVALFDFIETIAYLLYYPIRGKIGSRSSKCFIA